MDKPLSVAVGSVAKNGKILMIKRESGDYQGYWALPGGKIEQGEHVSDAAVREIREEAGIESSFDGYLGMVSEVFGEKQFMLHVLRLEAEEKRVSGGSEGVVEWLQLESLENLDVVPSDLEIVKEVVMGDGGYFECVISESDGDHFLEEFAQKGRGFQD